MDWFCNSPQSIAQAGLQYGKDKYDIERYEEIRRIAAEMISAKTNISAEKVYNLFCNETGYQTPKVDTRAAVFVDGKISSCSRKIMAHGHCREDGVTLISSVASNTEKEVKEESD